MIKRTLSYYLPAFVKTWRTQLESDQERWGDTWKTRPVEANEKFDHQVDRAYKRFEDYYDQWKNGGTPIPWFKIAGECLICWVRENFPDYMEH